MLTIAKRNIKVFFRDKMNVFFSLLSVMIIIGLYVLFLGDLIVSDMAGIEGARFLMDSWIMAGTLAVSAITTTMGAFGVMVDDKAKRIEKDFSASPIKRYQLAGGYILSSFTIGIIMSLATLVLAEIYIIAYGGEFMGFYSLIKLLGVIFLSVLSGSSMVFFLISFFKSQSAFATASTIIGTLIGFLTGIYVPIGNLPKAVQTVIKVFPISHAASLARQIMMKEPMAVSFKNAPAETIHSFSRQLGVVFEFGDFAITPLVSILVLIATTMLFYSLAIVNVSRKSK